MNKVQKHPKAYFVRLPFRIDDLLVIYHPKYAVPYIIEKIISIPAIDYENFITDLCVDRWFIEDNASLCRIDSDGIWHCILVKQRHRDDGVLVMSDGRVFPFWAAYMPSIEHD